MKSAITIVGNTNLDVMVSDTHELPAPGTERVVSSVSIRLGGSAGNLALRCAGLRFPTTLISRVGNDTSVQVLESELKHPSLDVRLLRTYGEPSGVTVAIEAPGRDRAFLSSLGAMALLRPEDVDEAMLATEYVALAGYFLLPGMRGPGLTDLFNRAHQAGARTVLDTGWPPEGWTKTVRQEILEALTSVDVFLPNNDELHGLMNNDNTEQAARELAVRTNTLVAVKMGALGAGIATPNGSWAVQEADTVEVIDSTGAGDGFNAAFLVSAARGSTWQEALAAAVRYATEMVATVPELRTGVALRTKSLASTQKQVIGLA